MKSRPLAISVSTSSTSPPARVPSIGERPSALWTEFFNQLLAEPIVPSPCELGDCALEAMNHRSLRRIGKEAEMQARRVALAECEVEINQCAVERRGESVL